jgi:pimeloyl-ACP methyl ester carboxylesterase
MPSIQVNGINVEYQLYGEGPPLLLIHGLGSSGRDWEMQIDAFSEHFQVIVYDVRGHGKSEKPSGRYSVPLFAKDCAEILRALGFDKVHVVGISMGGMIALQLAADCPEIVQDLVIVNSGPDLVVRSIKDLILFWQRLIIVKLLGMRKMGEVLSKRLFPKPDQGDLREIFVERWAENDPRAYNQTLKGLVGWSVVEKLSLISCPTLIVAADQDYTPLEVKSGMVEQIPNAQLVVMEGAHHAAPMEYPDQFNQILRDFLGSRR